MSIQAEGLIFEIQRFSIHDGPGIRTTVFLMGCPLSCLWCHNPEGQSTKPLLSYLPQKCIGCGNCVKACPHGAHQMVDGHHVFDRALCQTCGACTKACWSKALEMVGRQVTVNEVMNEVIRDLPFYENSGGGLTISGGEPTAQPEFSQSLLQAARDAGIHTAIETCGFAPYQVFKNIMPLVDLFLFDVKDMDSRIHQKHTGVPNTLILENLKQIHDAGARILLRLPLIEGYNDRPDHFDGIAALVKSLPNLVGIEVMPYHRLGNSKHERFGSRSSMPDDVPAADEKTIAAWLNQLAQRGVTTVNPHPDNP